MNTNMNGTCIADLAWADLPDAGLWTVILVIDGTLDPGP